MLALTQQPGVWFMVGDSLIKIEYKGNRLRVLVEGTDPVLRSDVVERKLNEAGFETNHVDDLMATNKETGAIVLKLEVLRERS
jgi:hypothetical protein